MQVSIFPVQMHYALEDMERNGQSHIASWRPHGRCFQVHDREAFTTTILPRYAAVHFVL
jgi:HSF-type DNA-binding